MKFVLKLVRFAKTHLQDVSDQNQDALDDEAIVLAALSIVQPQQLSQGLRQDGPQLFVDKGSFISLTMPLQLHVVISGDLVLRELLAKQQQLGPGEVDQKSQHQVEKLLVVRMVTEEGNQIGLHDADLTEAPPQDVAVVVLAQVEDQVLDALEALVLAHVLDAIVGSQRCARRLDFHSHLIHRYRHDDITILDPFVFTFQDFLISTRIFFFLTFYFCCVVKDSRALPKIERTLKRHLTA